MQGKRSKTPEQSGYYARRSKIRGGINRKKLDFSYLRQYIILLIIVTTGLFTVKMNICIAEPIDYSVTSGVAISLSGKLPDTGRCFHVPRRDLPGSMSFTVKVATALYTLCCNWEKIKFNCSVSLQKVKRVVNRTLSRLMDAIPMRPAAILTANSVRLRL